MSCICSSCLNFSDDLSKEVVEVDKVDIAYATIDDLNDLILIEDSSFKTDKLSRRQMRYMLSKAKAFILLAKIKSVTVAYCICFIPALPRTARLYSLAVLKEYRNRGIADQLIKNVLKKLQSLGYTSCNLEVRTKDASAKSLYIKNDFKEVQFLPAYYEDGEDGIRMKRLFDNDK